MEPSDAQLRPFIIKKLSEDEIRGVCFDYFPNVYDDLTAGMTKSQMAELLVGYCRRNGRILNLRAALHTINPNAFPVAAQKPQAYAPIKRNPRQVFISHAHQDAELAQQLATDLEGYGFGVWIAPDSILPGEKWVAAVNRGLEESGVFVLLLTEHAVKSKWVQKETNVAIELETESELRLLPLQIRPCRLPPLWRAYQRISFRAGYADGRNKLLAALDLHVKPVEQDVESTSRDTKVFGIMADSLIAFSREAQVIINQMGNQETRSDTFIHPKTEQTFIRIPAGKFLYGKDKQEMELPEFWISKTPVTNVEYARFVAATGYEKPRNFESNLQNKQDHPVVYVSWHDAQAYCVWAGLELPTEEQWEKAARGTTGLVYPWGNDWENGRCNSYESGINDTTPVGQFSPQGDSPYGCVDMSGNVWEWTASWYDAKQISRALRGGSWKANDNNVRASDRGFNPPNLRLNLYGFRLVCARGRPSQNDP